MTRLHWILALAVVATWVPSYAYFFHGDVMHWWRGRAERRRQERQSRADYEAEQARLREELAAKYIK